MDLMNGPVTSGKGEFLRRMITDWARPETLRNDARKWCRR
jgi:hypothetical protein